MDEPESRSALATSFLPPGPLSKTWLVIIRISGTAGGLVDESVLVVTVG